MPEPAGRILVVDDEADIRDALEMVLKYERHAVDKAADGARALEAIEKAPPDAVILDVKMPGRDGLEVLEEIGRRFPGIPVIMISGHADRSTGWAAARKGAFDFLDKPLDEGQVLVTVRNALAMRRAESEVAALVRECAEELAVRVEIGQRVGRDVRMAHGRSVLKVYTARLLHGVRDLVRDQVQPERIVRRVRARGEVDVVADRVRARVERVGRVRGRVVGVHAHARQVGVERAAQPHRDRVGQRRARVAARVAHELPHLTRREP